MPDFRVWVGGVGTWIESWGEITGYGGKEKEKKGKEKREQKYERAGKIPLSISLVSRGHPVRIPGIGLSRGGHETGQWKTEKEIWNINKTYSYQQQVQ